MCVGLVTQGTAQAFFLQEEHLPLVQVSVCVCVCVCVWDIDGDRVKEAAFTDLAGDSPCYTPSSQTEAAS